VFLKKGEYLQHIWTKSIVTNRFGIYAGEKRLFRLCT